MLVYGLYGMLYGTSLNSYLHHVWLENKRFLGFNFETVVAREGYTNILHHFIYLISGYKQIGHKRILLWFQVYPTSVRALGLGACSGVARCGAIITPFIAQVTTAQLGVTQTMYDGESESRFKSGPSACLETRLK